MASRASVPASAPSICTPPNLQLREVRKRKFGSAQIDASFWTRPVPRKSSTARFLKRGLDIVLSAIGLIVTCPIMAVLAVLIKLDSPGPAIYRSLRAGKDGQLFICYKLRTMRADADQEKDYLRCRNERRGPFFKLACDPRVTRLGRVLRRYSLDELPQLWNVLHGEMSLVGPRPHPLDDVQRYQRQHLNRLRVTPGLTGLWQVTARQDPSFGRNMALDMEYIEHGNFWMDLKILCKTVSVVLQGSGV